VKSTTKQTINVNFTFFKNNLLWFWFKTYSNNLCCFDFI